MKKFAKIMAVFAAIMMALAFAGCNNDDDDDPSTVAVYKTTWGEAEEIVQLATFYDDNTIVVNLEANNQNVTVMTGTYTGDPSKDGTITLSVTKFFDEDANKLVDATEEVKSYYDGDYEIKGGKVTFDGDEYIRQ